MTPKHAFANINGKLLLLRRNAIDIHRAFSELNPVIHRTRMLSLNAVVASARTGVSGDSFGVIAKELSGVSTELSRLIGEMETLFHTVVGHIARTVQAEDQARLYRRALGFMAAPDGAAPDDTSPEAQRALPAPGLVSGGEGHNVTILETQVGQSEGALIAGLEAVEALSRQLTQRIARINWVAVRQSHITAVAAQIEAARTPKGSGLMEIARIVRDLAAQIAVTESAAKQKIEDLEALAGLVVGPLRKAHTSTKPREAA
ncbi:MAG TPA: hypothetical protein VF678_04100 [bacterium]